MYGAAGVRVELADAIKQWGVLERYVGVRLELSYVCPSLFEAILTRYSTVESKPFWDPRSEVRSPFGGPVMHQYSWRPYDHLRHAFVHRLPLGVALMEPIWEI
jgi:hypothetical protein